MSVSQGCIIAAGALLLYARWAIDLALRMEKKDAEIDR